MEGVERHDLAPCAPPALGDGRIAATPEAFLEGVEFGFTGFGIDGPVDHLQRGGDGFSILVGDEVEAVTQQMNHAGLDHGFREDRSDCVLQRVNDGEQDILDAAVAQLVHNAQPELRALVLLDLEAEYLLGAVGADAECDVHGLVADNALVPDFDPERVEEDQGIDRLQRPRLPGGDLLQDRIGDGAEARRLHRDVLQPHPEARTERDAVTHRVRTAAQSESRGRPENSGPFILQIRTVRFIVKK
jgi:hypothetical protein